MGHGNCTPTMLIFALESTDLKDYLKYESFWFIFANTFEKIKYVSIYVTILFHMALTFLSKKKIVK